MSFKNRIITILLCFILMFGTVSASALDMNMFSDQAVNDYSQSLALFRKLGVFDINKDMHDVVTREEFAYLLTSFFGLKSLATSVETNSRFQDCADSPYASAIEYVVDTGMMTSSKNEFNPSGKLTTSELARGVVSGLGYGYVTEQTYGNSSSAYTSMAVKLKLFDEVSMKDDSYGVIYGDLIKIFENALTTDLMEMSLTSGNRGEYFVAEGKNLMNTILDFEEKSGIVTGTPITDLYGGEETSEGYVKIDNEEFKYDVDMTSLLGYRVRYFVKKDRSDETLVYVCKDYKYNAEIVIESEDIYSHKNRKYTYYDENDKKKSFTLPAGCVIVYNGRTNVLSNHTGFNMIPENGYIKGIDNDNDRQYDIIIIEAFQTLVVGAVDELKKVLYDKFNLGNEVSLEEIAEDRLFIYDKDNRRIDFSKIKAGNIVSIAVSQDKTLARVMVSSAKVSGVVDTILSESIKVDGNFYEFSKDAINKSSLKPGRNYTLFFDKDGLIHYFEENQLKVEAAFLINAAEDGVIEKKLMVNVLTMDGSLKIMEVADNYYLNNSRRKGGSALLTELKKNIAISASDTTELAQYYKSAEMADKVKPQMITYACDDLGKVKYIFTAQDSIEDCPPERLWLITSDERAKYQSGGYFDGMKVVTSPSCKVLFLPKYDQLLGASEDEFYVKDASYLENDKEYYNESSTGTVYPYFVYGQGDTSLLANFMVVNVPGRVRKTKLAIVKEVAQSLDADGAVYTSILYESDTGEGEGCIYPESGIDVDFKVGDCVIPYYETVKNKEVWKSCEIVYQVDTGICPNGIPSATNATYLADVYRKEGAYAYMIPKQTNEDIPDNFNTKTGTFRVENLNSALIFRYSTENGIPEIIKDVPASNIIDYKTSKSDYTRCLVFTAHGKAKIIYIVEKAGNN